VIAGGDDGAVRAPRALLVCSSGGHLYQLHRLEPWWRDLDRLWVTFDTEDARSLLAGEQRVSAYRPTTRNARNAVRNFALALRVLRWWRPDIVVSTGAGVAFPFFVSAKLLRIPSVYVEVYDRIDRPTLTGRLCHPFASRFFLQVPEQQRFYPRGVVIGPLLP
jgi:UDP-N-acetylglucosamine:LPS N-acetylglucosamine transferase